MRDALFAFAWIVMLPISFWSAHIGILLWVWVALLTPTDLVYGFMSGVPFNKIVAIITLVVLVLSRDKKRFYFDPFIVLLVLFFVHGTISHLTAIIPTSDADVVYDKFYKELLLSLLITAIMWSRHRIHMAVLIVTLSYGFLMVKEGLIFLLTAGGHTVDGVGSVGDNNGLALAILMTLPLIYYLASYSAISAVRIGFLIAAGLGIVTVIATGSRGGFVGLVVLGLFVAGNSKRKGPAFLLVALAGLLIFAFAPGEWFSRLSTITEANDDSSFMNRVTVWKLSFLLGLDHPFFGGGFYAILRPQNWNYYKQFLSSLDFITTPPPGERTLAAHSIYFQAIGDFGFMGLALFLSLLGCSLLNASRIKRLTRREPSLEWAGDLARMLQVSLIVYMVAGGALSLVYLELLYILLALTSRTLRTVKDQLAEKPVPARAVPRRVPEAVAALR